MLDKDVYESLMVTFQSEFDENYTPQRIALLYSMVNKLTHKQINDLILELLCRYNKNNLPTPKEFITLAYIMYPDSKKESKKIKPFKIRVV